MIRFQAIPGATREGKVVRSGFSLNPSTRTLQTEIDIPNSDGHLHPGWYVTVTIAIDRKQVWTLPSNAIGFQGQQNYYVYLEVDGKPVRTPVIIGSSDDTHTEVLKKFAPGANTNDWPELRRHRARPGGQPRRPRRRAACDGGAGEAMRELEGFSAVWGFSPKEFQTRTIALSDKPTAWAMPRVLQWVAALGFSSRVLVTTSSPLAMVIVRGAPGRGSSASPSRRSSRKRFSHLPTVAMLTRSRAATSWLTRPSAQFRTIRARVASRWGLFADFRGGVT